MPRLEVMGDRQRVTACVAGTDVWFEAEGGHLEASPEAFAGLFLLQALQQGARIECEAPLDPRWRAGTAKLLAVYKEWWGFDEPDPIVAEIRKSDAPLPVNRKAAACFSRGVDAFYSLFSSQPELLLTHLSYSERNRRPHSPHLMEDVRTIGQRLDRQVVFFRSNLMDHPLHGMPSFLYTHGAALAALGLFLAPEIHSLTIPSSYTHENSHAWGSSWFTDPHFSTERVEIVHGEATRTRDEKIERIVNEPLAREYLSVCNRKLTEGRNCGRCQKCVRTRLAIRCAYDRTEWPTFADLPPLDASLDQLPHLEYVVLDLWDEMHLERLRPSERAAAERLFARTRRAKRERYLKSLWKRARRVVSA